MSGGDFSSFRLGGALYPLPRNSPNDALQDIDPTIFHLLKYFAGVLDIHMGARLAAEAEAAGFDDVLKATVAMTVPFNPEPFLLEEGVKFPLLGAARSARRFRYIGTRKVAIDTVRVTYAFQSMLRDQAERLIPFMAAAAAILDNRTEQSFDPAYAPPGGSLGDVVWGAKYAGLCRVEIVGFDFGGFMPTSDTFFPCMVAEVSIEERSTVNLATFEKLESVHTTTTIGDPGGETDVVAETLLLPAPELTAVSPTTGTKSGNVIVTITGVGFEPLRPYRVLFDGADASNVIAVSATSITCMTPQVDAYPTRTARVTIIDQNGQANEPSQAAWFVFTSP